VRILYRLHRTIDWDAPGISWSPDGNWLIFPDAPSVDDPSAIYALSVKSLQTKVLALPPNSYDGDYNPVFSPDGQHIAFVRGTDAAVRNLFIMNADGSGLRALTFNSRTVAGIAWTPDSSNLVFSSDIGGSLSLWRVPVSGGAPERLTVGGDNATSPAVSLRDNRLAFSEGSTEWSTMRLDLSTSVRKPVVLFSSTEKDSAVQYSPDNSLIAFQSVRSGSQEIWISQIDGSKPIRLTSFDGPHAGSPSWSPDGSQIAFDSRSGGWSHVFVMTSEGHNVHALTTGTYNDVIPSWSADGHWIYFGSRRSGRWEVWKSSLQSWQIQQVTNAGGFVARESTDGKWLYYTKYHHSGLWRMPSSGGLEERILDGPPSEFWGYWSVNSAGIYYLNNQRDHAVVELWTPSNGRSTVIVTLDRKPPPFSGVAVSHDNHWLAYSDGALLTQNIRLVENFK
jgi:Tol biopolymer transport system component